MLCWGGQGSLPAGAGDMPDFCTLVFRGHAINLELRYATRDTPIGPHCSFQLERLEIPTAIAAEQAEIIELIREASQAFRSGPKNSYINSSDIECDPRNIYFLNQD